MITVYSIPNCPNCKRLKMMLDKEMFIYQYRQFDPLNDDDVAEMCEKGIYTRQFPVVEIDGEILPATGVEDYMKRIKG